MRGDDGRLLGRLRDRVGRFDESLRSRRDGGRFLGRVRDGVGRLSGVRRSRERSGVRLLGLVVVYVRRKVSSTKNEAKVKEQRQTLVILAESPVDFTYDEQKVS